MAKKTILIFNFLGGSLLRNTTENISLGLALLILTELFLFLKDAYHKKTVQCACILSSIKYEDQWFWKHGS